MLELSKHHFSGVFTALVTPMKDGEIDHASVERHVEAQLGAGVHGLVVLGTTGEAATLSESEAERLLHQIVEMAKGRCTVVAGAGSNDTASAIAKARHAASMGADALLVVTPYYNKPSQAGLVAHFSAVAGSVDIPIMLYNVPGRTGVDLAVDVAARLARDFSNVIGIKEAGGRVERVTELRLACGEDFVIHSGDDNLTLPFLAMGADGVTSVASNLFPSELVELFAAWSQGDAKPRGSVISNCSRPYPCSLSRAILSP